MATGLANGSGFAYPIALHTSVVNRQGMTALATEDISPGCLFIPVFCMHDSSYLTPASTACRVSEGVSGSVKWKQPVDESDVREVEVEIYCQPERRLQGYLGYYRTSPVCHDHWTDCHPRRSNREGEFNSAVVEVAIKVIISSPLKELKTDLYHSSPGLLEFEVTVPCIVNTAKVAGGAEIVLRWEKKAAKKKQGRFNPCGSPICKKTEKRYMVFQP